MVRIALPPPLHPPDPLFYHLPTGTNLVRLFDPTAAWKPGPLTFNHNGPRNRFNHHRLPPPNHLSSTWNDPDHGVYYCAPTLSCCLVEVFGDYRHIDRPQLQIACPTLTRDLHLLDLCENGAMRVGAVSALCGAADRSLTQTWARYFYAEAVYQYADGLRYHSAHNNAPAFVLFERAENALVCPPNQVLPLTEPLLRPEILRIARENGLVVLI